MDIGSIFLILALLIVVGLYISRPLIERKATPISQVDQQLSALLAERDRVLNALRELDFDHSLGKIPSEGYPEQRAALVQRGADILRQLDVYSAQASSDEVDARIETALAARRASQPQPVSSNGKHLPQPESEPDEALEALIAARRRQRQGKSAGFCPQCGQPVQQTDRFCPKCGTSLG